MAETLTPHFLDRKTITEAYPLLGNTVPGMTVDRWAQFVRSQPVYQRSIARAVLATILLVILAVPARADAARGAALAERWCAACHVIGPGRGGSVPQGPPTFPQVARSGLTADQLRAFLSHPHGAMPDLSLTRAEIDDLVAYIATLR
jgi:mono/diheme cytochrome c family protein